MRSDTCNKYQCRAARDMLKRIETHNPDGVLCLAGKGADFRQASYVQNDKIANVPLGMVTPEHNHG
jgi:hypothetical protein